MDYQLVPAASLAGTVFYTGTVRSFTICIVLYYLEKNKSKGVQLLYCLAHFFDFCTRSGTACAYDCA